MIDLHALKDLFPKIAVLGLGVSGQTVVKALQQSHIPFTVWDDAADARDAATQQGLDVANPVNICSEGDLVIRSVGMKPDHPVITALENKRVALWNDLDLLYLAAPKARYIGITGTNGKSTTTSLIGHILQQNGVKMAVGGNLGPAAPSLDMLDDTGVYVLELSSYQLATAKLWRCDIAVCLNITEDHLEWHGTMESYTAAKALIFRLRDHQMQHAIIGIDTPQTKQLHETLKQSYHHHVIGITQHASEPADGQVAVINGDFIELHSNLGAWPDHAILKGTHNIENRLAAYAACRAVGLSSNHILASMASFGGLKHRQQPVATHGPVTFINDSKATNADAAAKALAVFDNVYWIVGGKAKTDGIDGLEAYYLNIKQAYLIGDATDRFAAQLDGQLPYQRCETIAQAVRAAYRDAQQSDQPATILLSPSCASFDQYPNFEKRGDDFIDHVQQLLREVSP